MLTALSQSLICDGGGSQLHETSVVFKRSDQTPVTSSVHPPQGQMAAITYRWSGQTWSMAGIFTDMLISQSSLEQSCSRERLEGSPGTVRYLGGATVSSKPHPALRLWDGKNALCGPSGGHLPLYWLVPGSDCHFTYEHGDNSVSRC